MMCARAQFPQQNLQLPLYSLSQNGDDASNFPQIALNTDGSRSGIYSGRDVVTTNIVVSAMTRGVGFSGVAGENGARAAKVQARCCVGH